MSTERLGSHVYLRETVQEADMVDTGMHSERYEPEKGMASGACWQSGTEQASVSGIRMESLSTEDGLPPCITTGDQVLREGWAAFERASRIAKENGIADMSLDEINAEIAEARKNL
ncbi:MAG: hypothetical protein SOW06_00045 [Succinivibrionaceae bacterium]|jgi:DNA-damage-inducible protein J|nr:hypothetical protein [Succinivibrionaceae bacterium]MDD6546037.1 toxin-antitoxin system antitoxin subunit [Pseudomonadota bacterium]MDY3143744.1 hypothetical protein [Succinivibrionaceae bacterium]MDY6335737.1 hypothetical protein [Succinivibrionaceae bacterium]